MDACCCDSNNRSVCLKSVHLCTRAAADCDEPQHARGRSHGAAQERMGDHPRCDAALQQPGSLVS